MASPVCAQRGIVERTHCAFSSPNNPPPTPCTPGRWYRDQAAVEEVVDDVDHPLAGGLGKYDKGAVIGHAVIIQ